MQSGSSIAPQQYYCVGFLLLPFLCGSRHGSFLPSGWVFCLAVVLHGGRGSTALAEVPPPVPARLFIFSVAGVAAVPWVGTVVPHSRAVVPLGCKQ